MRKKNLVILTALGYGWMAGLGWCEAPGDSHYMANDSVLEEKEKLSIIVPHKSTKVVKGTVSEEVKSVSGIGSPLFSQDANALQTTQEAPSDQVEPPPPPPTNLRIVIIR